MLNSLLWLATYSAYAIDNSSHKIDILFMFPALPV